LPPLPVRKTFHKKRQPSDADSCSSAVGVFCCFESGAPQIAPDKNKSVNFEW
jgi:hypothetical protein